MLRLTFRHHYDFGEDTGLVDGDLVREGTWDAMRTQTSGPFAIADDRAQLERYAEGRVELERRAAVILALARDREADSIVSYGAGTGLLEHWMVRLGPGDIALTLTDYAPATVERLVTLFPDARVVAHDLRTGPLAPGALHLFHRIDAELDGQAWRQVLQRFGAVPVLFVATEVASTRRLLAELRVRVQAPHAARAGFLRNRAAFEALWSKTHDASFVQVADLEGWLLEPKMTAGRERRA